MNLYQQAENPRENNSSVQKSLQSLHLFVLTKHADLGPVDMQMVITTVVHKFPKKSSSHLKILGAKNGDMNLVPLLTNPQILGSTVQNFVATATTTGMCATLD